MFWLESSLHELNIMSLPVVVAVVVVAVVVVLPDYGVVESKVVNCYRLTI